MKKKLLFVFAAAVLWTAVFGVLGVSAAKSGIYTYRISNGKAQITDCDPSAKGNLVIPSSLGGCPVTSIGYEAFYGCTGLTGVTIPDSVTSIGDRAFWSCTGLTAVTIPKGVTSIEYEAFSGCTGLTAVTIPKGVTSIEYKAFSGCTGLTGVTIPDSVTSIGNFAFSGCTGLTGVTIPEGVTNIGSYAFDRCTGLTGVTIPDSVTSIGNSAFRDCTGLTGVTIPEGVTSIGNATFYDCTGLTGVTIPEGVTSIGDFAFYGCTGLTGVTIPEGVTSIGNSAFEYCTGFTDVTIPDSVTRIGDSAFYGCTGLTGVYITDIAAWCAIDFGDSLANPLNYANNLYLNGALVTDLVIPKGVTSIGDRAFYGCTGLTGVTIPDSVTSIGDFAFRDCTGLNGVTIPDSVTSIGTSVFYGCTGLTGVTIPEGVTSIGEEAFSGCTGLTGVTIPDSVTSIGYRAFSGCTGLNDVTIPDSVTSIGYFAFRDCTGLTGVYITDIAAWCAIDFGDAEANPLYYANNLYLNGALVTDLVIPKGVTSIGDYAFHGCTGLTGVTIPEGVTSIGTSAFESCNRLVYADIGSGADLIPERMFYRCENLRYVGLSAGVKYVRNDAFNYCENLETVFYAGSASQWNEILFYNRNENLTNANIIYHAKKKTYRFETNCSAVLEAVTDYAVFTMPEVENDGKTFRGWYDNRELSGSPVTFPYYGGAAVLYAAWTDKTGADFDDALATRANQEYTVTTTESDQLVYFEFVPSRSKEYHIYTTGSRDTYGYLYNSKRAQIASDDDAGDGNNFYISHALTAGERYYIAAKVYRGAGTFTLVVEEPVDYRINAITIKDMAGNGLQEIPRGTFLATVSFTNVGAASDAVIVLARYTETGAFEGLMHIQTEDVPKGSTIKLSIPVDNEKGDVAKLKAFCWDASGALKPMGNTAAFPAE